MDFGENSFKKALNQGDKAFRKLNEKSVKEFRKGNERSAKALKQSLNVGIKSFITKEGRVRIPSARRHEVEAKYHNKCAVCKLKPKGVTLQIHHKNGNNRDNSLKNLELLCPNHHYGKHAKGSKVNKAIRKRTTKRKSNSLW